MPGISKGVMVWAVVGHSILVGCGASVDLGADDVGGGGRAAQESSTPPPAETCPSGCADPVSDVETLPTAEAFYAAIVGRWQICAGGEGAFANLPSDAIGVEYDEPRPVEQLGETVLYGDMYYLVMGADGPERGPNIDYELVYNVSPTNLAQGPPSQLNMHPTPNSGFFGSFVYDPCPRQWLFYNGVVTPEQRAFLVPLD